MIESMMLDKKEGGWYKYLVKIFLLFLTLFGVIYTGFKNYLLFHVIVEFFSIIIAFTISIIVLNTYKANEKHYLIFLGIAYGFIATFDFLHTMTYKGMGIFQTEGANMPTQLWLIARCMESISLFLSGLFLTKKLNFLKTIGIYIAVSIFLIFSVYIWGIFPEAYIEGVGLTSFKIISEYIISSIFLASIVLFIKSKNLINPKKKMYLIVSIFTSIISELFFTMYIDVYDIFTILGHILKVISFYYIYRSVVEFGIKLPYDELHKSEKKYHNLVELLPDCVFVVNQDKIVLSNTRFTEFLGYKHDKDVIGKSLFESIDESTYFKIQKYIKGLQLNKVNRIQGEEKIEIKGKDMTFDIIVSPFIYETHSATLVVMRDITETKKAKQLEESIEKNKIQLKESLEYDRMKTEFYSNLSHEMKTPLNLIFSTVQVLELELKNKLKDSESLATSKHILILRQNCYRMVKLVSNLLDITKMDAGYFKIDVKNYNIVNIVEEITLSIADYIEKNDVTLIFDTEVEEKIVALDSDSMERIMLNLLSNAIKFTNPGDEIRVNIYHKEGNVLISVKDTGVGMPKHKLQGIFDRFTQVDKTLNRNKQGTGLGLSLVESLVRIQGGKISAFSELGEGTEFVIELPAKKIDYEASYVEDYNTEDENKYIEKINIEFSDIYSTSQPVKA